MSDFLDKLAREELNPAEVREILRRLAITEFGGPANATIADVSEASGTSPETVGRMLADVRGTSWLEWKHSIEAAIAEQNRRLRSLESSATKPNGFEDVDDVELYERVERGRRAKQAQGWPVAIIIAVSFMFLFARSGRFRTETSTPASEWYPGLTQFGTNGHNFGYNGACVWSEEGPDHRPGPIVHEEDSRNAMMTLAQMKEAHCP